MNLEELYAQNARIVYRYLCSLCRDERLAEDLMQETFLQAWKSIERFDGSCRISSWLCQIAKHLLYRHYQKSRREIPAEPQEGWMVENASPSDRAAAKQELLEVFREMQKLPAHTREVIYLRITGELTFREIGEIMGRTENWARVTFYRGKETLWKGKPNGRDKNERVERD